MLSAFHAGYVASYGSEDLAQAAVRFTERIQLGFAEQCVAVSRPAAKRTAISARRCQDDPARSAQVADERT